jgi:magnesium chelatase family protein
MLARVLSCTTVGLDGVIIEVEVDSGPGQPGFVVVGLPDAAVQESRERVRSAIRHTGFRFPLGRITANLAPADIRKAGPSYDLPIALAVLLASEQVAADVSDALFIGELSLDGSLRHTSGILPMVAVAASQGIKRVFVPWVNADEAALVEEVEVYPVDTLDGLVRHFVGLAPIPRYLGKPDYDQATSETVLDFAHIRGQEQVKRGLEVAAAGGHNALLVGPPGTGKTLLARSMPSILPSLNRDEAIEVTKIYSVAGMLTDGNALVRERPFRSPHHTVSYAGLVGGGKMPRPGEISLAHRGVLFLDELPEFGSQVLEVLRQPLEDRQVTISRASGAIRYPANFILIAAMNPCPCGYLGHPTRECSCSSVSISRYQKRISGPLLDRIDIRMDVPQIEYEKLADVRPGEPSAAIRERVEAGRERQARRFAGTPLRTNADMGAREVQRCCRLDEASDTLMRAAMRRYQLSARAYHRILKLSRTIADLAGADEIQQHHLAEALQYRPNVAP